MKDTARKVFATEIESLQHVAAQLDHQFDGAVSAILNANGRTVICGVGKSGIIAKKIAATLTSTGTPCFFLHPGEAFHGDLGIVGRHDPVILVSYSGETDEVLQVMPFLQWNQNIIIGITGNPASTLAKNSHYHLNVGILHEACPLRLAPTSSTTATLVMGDAVAVALMEARHFREEDFARFHPGGSLGHKLLAKVKDKMRTDSLPFIDEDATFTELLLCMSEGRLGMVMVGTAGNVKGIVTDGDLRRALIKYGDLTNVAIAEIMTCSPVKVDPEEHIATAEELMVEKKIVTLLIGPAGSSSVTGIYQIYNV